MDVLPRLVGCVLAQSLDIRSLWSLGHAVDDEARAPETRELLVFADGAALCRLRRSAAIAIPSVEVLVVVDGDHIESACGPAWTSGSLARWAWRRVSPCEARYELSRWDTRSGHAGCVVRVPRKGLLLWPERMASGHGYGDC